ncbi:hypothetical protein Hamer_G003090, partial [Homarus americanus]
RNQIPVQFDTLEREVAKTEGTPSHHSEVPTPQEHTADKVYSRKEEIARRTLHSKRQRWLTKVNNFLEVFNTVMQTLRTELNDGNVMAVNVILGSSIISGQEVFSIIFPRDCSSAPAECEVSNGRQTAMQFFRVLVTNDDLLKLVSKSLMFRRCGFCYRRCTLLTSDQTEFSCTRYNPCDLIPQPGYSPNFHVVSKLISIILAHLLNFNGLYSHCGCWYCSL